MPTIAEITQMCENYDGEPCGHCFICELRTRMEQEAERERRAREKDEQERQRVIRQQLEWEQLQERYHDE